MAAAPVDDDLFDTVAADFLARFRNGERPTVEDYTERHPGIADEIRELFPTMLAIERMKFQKELSSGGQASLGARQLQQLGDFRIIREIGRGGMGIVFEAEQESLERRVALKVLPPHALQDDTHVRRFHREAQTAARLHHTNIVPVFGVGEDDGLHYYVMQLIEGEPLDRGLQGGRREPLAPRQAAAIVRQIADAVQFAHDQGTLHRDIKPANLLLDRDGHVWITDFGLAQVLERDETATDHVAGTLRYMAPERFQGIADERTDQYSLGITLYELVTGVRAFEGSSTGQLMHRITHGAPTALRTLAPQLPRDLQTIIEKAIAREPSHRYRRVGDLAEDLQRFLDGQSILARRISPPERLWRWCRRNRALAASLASVAALLAVVAAMLSIGYYRSRANALRLEGVVAEKDDALERESTALDNERAARERSEAITSLALNGLDQVFDEFAPAAPYTIALPVAGSDEDDDPLLLPAQATVTPQVAAALERLLPLYQQLSDETADDADIRLRSASAQFRLGLIYRQLGRQDSARAAFWAARSQLEALHQEQAIADEDLRLLLARVLNELGDVDRQSNQSPRERRAAHQQALDLLTAAAVDDLNREEHLELARTHFFLGRRDFGFGPPPPSRTNGPGRTNRGRRDRDADRSGSPPPEPGPPSGDLPPPPPDGAPPPPAPADRGPPPSGSESRLGPGGGPFRGGFGFVSREGTREHLRQAIALLEGLPYAERDTRVQLLLARCYHEQSNQRPFDDRDSRRADWEKSVALLTELVHESPSTPDFRFELSETYADIEPRFLPPDRLPEAESRLREALALSEPLIADAPDVPAYAAGQTQTLLKLAYILKQTDRTDEAKQRYLEAIALQIPLAQEHPETPTHVVWIARVKRSLAIILLGEQRFDEAAALLREAGAAVEPLLQSPNDQSTPAMRFAAFTLSETYRTLADILQDQGETDEADAYRRKSYELGPARFFLNRRPQSETPGQ